MHWPHFIVHSFHNIVQPNVQHVVHNANCAIVHNFEQFAPTLPAGGKPIFPSHLSFPFQDSIRAQMQSKKYSKNLTVRENLLSI